MDDTPLLRVRGLTKRYGEFVVLDGIDLDLAPGRAIALRGRNGSGKSTLLRCITGLDKPDEGKVELDGRSYDERSPRVRREVAAVLDDLDFFPDLSVVEHLDLLAQAHRVPDAEAVVDELLHQLQLIPQSGQLPTTLSSGQKRRLSLASALVRPRRLLVLDEPEARLDTEGGVWLAERLIAEKAGGLAILFASHSPALVDALADEVRVLDGPPAPEPAPAGES